MAVVSPMEWAEERLLSGHSHLNGMAWHGMAGPQEQVERAMGMMMMMWEGEKGLSSGKEQETARLQVQCAGERTMSVFKDEEEADRLGRRDSTAPTASSEPNRSATPRATGTVRDVGLTGGWPDLRSGDRNLRAARS